MFMNFPISFLLHMFVRVSSLHGKRSDTEHNWTSVLRLNAVDDGGDGPSGT
jgi:hypothetical protein